MTVTHQLHWTEHRNYEKTHSIQHSQNKYQLTLILRDTQSDKPRDKELDSLAQAAVSSCKLFAGQ